MYKKSKSIHVKSSASLLFNNLSTLVLPEKQITTYAVVHKTVVNLCSCSMSSGTGSHSTSPKQVSCKDPSITQVPSILQAKFCTLNGRNVLVLCSQQGVQMFESDGSVMVFWYALPALDSTQGLHFTRGIAVLPENHIAVGVYTGEILIFKVPPQGTNITLLDTLKCHDQPITSIATEGAVMASADNTGSIAVWEMVKDEIGRVAKINGGGSSCSSVVVYKQMVIAGYGSGHIRVFDAFNGSMMVEICAHARWIHAIDIAPESGLLISTSEDTYVRVWSLIKKGEEIFVQLEQTENVAETQLTGAQFLDPAGRSFCLAGYDSSVVVHYTKTE